MRNLWIKSLVVLLVLAASSAAAGRQARTSQRPAGDPSRQHFEHAVALERIGLYKEAETEYATALEAASSEATPQILEALQRVRNAERSAISAEADQQSDNELRLGAQLQKKGQDDEALAAFQSAYKEASSQEARERAATAFVGLVERKHSFWQQYIQDWLKPLIVKIVILFLSVYLLYQILGFIGRSRARFSRRIEVLDFDDSTDSGFGKAFPGILRASYQRYAALTKQSTALLAYHSGPATLPVMVPLRYHDFSEISLNVGGIEASKLLTRAARLLWRPYFTVSGAIYRLGEEIRVTSAIAKYNGTELRRDSVLWGGGGTNLGPRGAAYEIIATILREWNAKTR